METTETPTIKMEDDIAHLADNINFREVIKGLFERNPDPVKRYYWPTIGTIRFTQDKDGVWIGKVETTFTMHDHLTMLARSLNNTSANLMKGGDLI